MKLKLNTKALVTVASAITILFFLVMFGVVGLRTLVGLVVMVLPVFLIMRKWFSREEALFFSFFVTIGLFTAPVYYLAAFTGMKIAIVLVFILLIALPYLIPKKEKKVEIPVVQ